MDVSSLLNLKHFITTIIILLLNKKSIVTTAIFSKIYYFNSSGKSSSSNSGVVTINNSKVNCQKLLLGSTHRKTAQFQQLQSERRSAIILHVLYNTASYARTSSEWMSGKKTSLVWTLRTTRPMFAHKVKHARANKITTTLCTHVQERSHGHPFVLPFKKVK